MMSDTMVSTNEDERLINKINRLITANIERNGLVKGKSDNNQKEIPQIHFSICVKQTPFEKFAGHRLIQECNTEPDHRFARNISSPFKYPAKGERLNHSEETTDYVPKAINGKKKFRKKRARDPLKPFCTFPLGILKKGTESKYSQNFERYISIDASKMKEVEEYDDDDIDVEASEEMCELVKLPVRDKNADDAYDTGEAEDMKIFSDNSMYNTQKTTVRVFQTINVSKSSFNGKKS